MKRLLRGPRGRRHRQGGFTLMELMVSLVIFAFAISGVLAVAVSMVQGFREQRMTVSAEGAVRGALDYISDIVRQASPAAPTGNIQDAKTCWIGAVKLSNGTGLNGSDKLDLIYAAGSVVTSSRTAYVAGTTSLDVADATGLAVADTIVISNANQGHFVKITAISTNTLTLEAQCGTIALPAGGYVAGSLVVRAARAEFSIADSGDGTSTPMLWMDPDGDGTAAAEPLAEGVEDMQLALGIDHDNDGGAINEIGTAADDDDWIYNKSGDTLLTGAIRAVRITLVARTTTAGLAGGTNPFRRPALEDNSAGSTYDNHPRRVLRSIIEIRNMGGSP
jgi:prepilin-type N-terminal cleavage/methylation domain-containing protein